LRASLMKIRVGIRRIRWWLRYVERKTGGIEVRTYSVVEALER
jgi:hypothetical protein